MSELVAYQPRPRIHFIGTTLTFIEISWICLYIHYTVPLLVRLHVSFYPIFLI